MDPENRFLAQCEHEALHLSGAIQPHGTLLVTGAGGLITDAAANAEAYFGSPAEAWLGQPLPPVLAPLAAALPEAPGSRRTMVVAEGPARRWEVVATRGAEGAAILEVTPNLAADGPWLRLAPAEQEATPRDAAAMAEAETGLTERIAALTGFQRVMFYRFREDGDGEVAAEAHGEAEAYGSYLGLRFPASDIPMIARALYLKNPWRMIPDAAAAPVPILGLAGAAPDLSRSDLRSVSPVHQAYLANMGVGASLSFPIAEQGRLVALIAAHHREPRLLPLRVLEQGAALVRSHAFAATSYKAQARMQLVDGLAHRFQDLRAGLVSPDDLVARWSEAGPWLLGEFAADGAQLCLDGAHVKAGTCGEPGTLASLHAWLDGVQDDGVAHTDHLAGRTGQAEDPRAAGALGLRMLLRDRRELRLFLTRREHPYEVTWGGNPDKPLASGDAGQVLSPRHSFEAWVEKRTGRCRPWSSEARLLGLSLRRFLYDCFSL